MDVLCATTKADGFFRKVFSFLRIPLFVCMFFFPGRSNTPLGKKDAMLSHEERSHDHFPLVTETLSWELALEASECFQQGHYERASRLLRRLVELRPTDRRVRHNLIVAEHYDKISKGSSHLSVIGETWDGLRRGCSRLSVDAVARYNVALLSYMDGRIADAMRLLEEFYVSELLSDVSMSIQRALLLADCYVRLGKIDDAEQRLLAMIQPFFLHGQLNSHKLLAELTESPLLLSVILALAWVLLIKKDNRAASLLKQVENFFFQDGLAWTWVTYQQFILVHFLKACYAFHASDSRSAQRSLHEAHRCMQDRPSAVRASETDFFHAPLLNNLACTMLELDLPQVALCYLLRALDPLKHHTALPSFYSSQLFYNQGLCMLAIGQPVIADTFFERIGSDSCCRAMYY